MSKKDLILKAIRLSCFCFLCVNIFYFLVYAVLFAGDFASTAELLTGGPNAKLLLFLPICLLVCFLLVFLRKNQAPLKPAMLYFGNVGLTFAFFYVFFLCVHFAYLDFGGSEETVASYILLGSTSFRLLGTVLIFSLLLPFLNMILRAESLKLPLRFFLHGAAILFILSVFNIVFFNGFSSASVFLMYFLIAVLLYTVFATIYASWSHHRSVQQEKDYKRVFRKK